MAFFGMYPSKYIGGSRFGFYPSAGLYNGGHPSPILNGVNYFSGAPVNGTQTVQTVNQQPVAQTAPAAVQANTITGDNYLPQTENAKIQSLENSLNSAKNEQGVFGKLCDGVKGLTGIGLSSKKCKKYIENVKAGNMSYEEAYGKISKYSAKQKNTVNILTGIASGVITAAALGFAPVTGGTSLIAAAGIGAASKAGLKTLDRATNNIDDDALNIKQIAKDGLTGAIDGAVSVATAGFGKGAVAGATSAKEAVKLGAIAGAKGGAVSGAVIGAGDYTVECAFEEDQKFELDGLITNTAYGAAAGAITGAAVGAVTSGGKFKKDNQAPKPDNTTPPQDGGGAPVDSGSSPVSGDNPGVKGAGGKSGSGTDDVIYIDPDDVEIIDTPNYGRRRPFNPKEETIIDAEFVEIKDTGKGIPTGTDVPRMQQPKGLEAPKTDGSGVSQTAVTGENVNPALKSAAAPEQPNGVSQIELEGTKLPEIPEHTSANPQRKTVTLEETSEIKPLPEQNKTLVAVENSGEVKPPVGIENAHTAAESESLSAVAAETTPQTAEPEIQADPIKDNLSRLINGKKGVKAQPDAASDNLKKNTANLINEKKLGLYAKILALFGIEK